MDNIMLEIFEEIKTKQTEQSKQLTEQSRQLTKLSEQQETLSSTLATQIAPTVAESLTPLEPQIVRHVHRLELKTSRWLIITVGLSVFLIGSTVLNYNQHKAIKQIETNDLKYRYIKAQQGAGKDDINMLQTIFEYEPDAKKQEQLRKWVMDYERTIEERAADIERAKLTDAETERLRDEAKKFMEVK